MLPAKAGHAACLPTLHVVHKLPLMSTVGCAGRHVEPDHLVDWLPGVLLLCSTSMSE